MTTATELFTQLNEGSTGAQIDRIFRQMDEAEAEIKTAQSRHPSKAQEIWDAFRQLQPTEPIQNKAPLYAAHCAELLDRVARAKNTTPSTKAEILGFLVDLSLTTPMTNPQEHLYWSLVLSLGVGTSEMRALAQEQISYMDGCNSYWGIEAGELQAYLRNHVNQEPRPQGGR